MRRALIMLVLVVVAVFVRAGTANAARGQVLHFRYHGTVVSALWTTATTNASTDTYILAANEKRGPELRVNQTTFQFDGQGAFAGETDTLADVYTGFSFTISGRLASAQAHASDIPARTCTYDKDFNLTGCSDSTLSADAAWTGVGSISHDTVHEHFQGDCFVANAHSTGTGRNATATGMIGGISLSSSTLDFADMGSLSAGDMSLTIGENC